ncbi:hypothetical protein CMI45_00690 [Candidatus Pacearchaeota archaeon]|jgi:GT2 family glycosyltransferase|nr:hypothetical protein [Candidatus Pacearchaeota archaeon]|tara:strand:+ start:799 stop:1593 length:795 start_codon:yes stop_codon:yes gene_type:complete
MKTLTASVIIPVYNPDPNLLKEIVSRLKKQTVKPEILLIDQGLPEFIQTNIGLKKASGDVLITLSQDCLPENETWLESLIAPFKDKEVVATTSDLELPHKTWKKFDLLAKILTIKEQTIITPALDGRATAYRSSALKKIGYMNESRVTVAGDDDTYLKIKKLGKIAYPHAKVFHIHKSTGKERLLLEYRYAKGSGTSLRLFSFNLPGRWKTFLRIFPFFGIFGFLARFPIKRSLKLFTLYALISPLLHVIYTVGFWKGFLFIEN